MGEKPLSVAHLFTPAMVLPNFGLFIQGGKKKFFSLKWLKRAVEP